MSAHSQGMTEATRLWGRELGTLLPLGPRRKLTWPHLAPDLQPPELEGDKLLPLNHTVGCNALWQPKDTDLGTYPFFK